MFDLATIYAVQPDAILKEFRSFAAWSDYVKQMELIDRTRARGIVQHVEAFGVGSLVGGGGRGVARVMQVDDTPRWEVLVSGMNNTERSVAELLAATPFAQHPAATAIYAAEAMSPLAMHLRATYPRFIGSQYAPDLPTQQRIYPIQHQDLTRLTYEDGVFDVAISIEVLEHVPFLDKALGELSRVLKPGGILLSTFPFLWDSPTTQRRARMESGSVVHLVDTPEYHGDPMQDEGILVFQIPGWDVIDLAKASGFRDAAIVFYTSAIGGMFGSDAIGRFVFVGYR